MNNNIRNIVQLFQTLSRDEKAQVLNIISGKSSADMHRRPNRPAGRGVGRSVYGSDNNINFAPVPGQKCPTCGK